MTEFHVPPDAREAAWDAVHEALRAFWRVGPVIYDPGVVRPDGLMGAFSVTARGPHPGRGKMPVPASGAAGGWGHSTFRRDRPIPLKPAG